MDSSVPAGSFRKVCKVWDLSVVLSVWVGFCFSRISAINSSLVFAWLVFLCDLVYTTDAVARITKQVCFSTITAGLSAVFGNASIASKLQLSTHVPVILTFVPYHVLVVLGWDTCGVYMLLCALRAATLVRSGRVSVHFPSHYVTAAPAQSCISEAAPKKSNDDANLRISESSFWGKERGNYFHLFHFCRHEMMFAHSQTVGTWTSRRAKITLIYCYNTVTKNHLDLQKFRNFSVVLCLIWAIYTLGYNIYHSAQGHVV